MMAGGPGLAFVLACAFTRHDMPDLTRARGAAAAVGDWKGVIRLAEHHRVVPAVHHAIERLGIITDPAWVAGQFAKRTGEIHARVAVAEAATTALAARFRAAGQEALFFKGMAAAHSSYAHPGLRDYSDVDLLVRRGELEAVHRLLSDLGYRRQLPDDPVYRRLYEGTHAAFTYRHPDTRAEIDVHWHLMPPLWRTALDLDALWRKARILTIRGLAVPTLGVDDELLVLCLHGTKERWNRARMVCDVAEHLAAHPVANWEDRLAAAAAQGCGRSLLLGPAMAREAFGLALPPALDDALRHKRWRGLTATAAAVLTADASGGARLGDYSTLRYAALDRNSDRLRYLMRLFACPRMKHLQVVRLPRPLFWLYYAVAPIHELVLLPAWRIGGWIASRVLPAQGPKAPVKG